MTYWLVKSEPDTYSFEQLIKDKSTWWTGVRNYQARNFMMNDMKIGDVVLFYHSSCEVPGIAGLATVSATADVDPTQFDKKSEFYDEKSKKESPRWFCVQVKPQKKMKSYVSLAQIRADKKLKNMLLLRPGQRLSIQPVTPEEYEHILKLSEV